MSMSLKYRHGQKFFWLSEQSQDEVILFTSWDSVQIEGASSEDLFSLAF
jgi:hypothetical protein